MLSYLRIRKHVDPTPLPGKFPLLLETLKIRRSNADRVEIPRSELAFFLGHPKDDVPLGLNHESNLGYFCIHMYTFFDYFFGDT